MDRGWRYLFWIGRRQWRPIACAVAAGLTWQGAAIVAPLLVRSAIDNGIVGDDTSALWWASAGLVVLGAVEAGRGGGGPRFARARAARRRRAALLPRQPQPRPRRRAGARRDLPPCARARRPLPRPRRRRR